MSEEPKKPQDETPVAEGFRKEFGHRLKFLRKRQRMTQAETADRLGMNYRHYQDIEAGKSDLKVSSLIKIAGFFQMPLDKLVDIGDSAPFASPMEHVERVIREVGNFFLAALTLRHIDGQVIFANKAALALGGYDLKDVVGKTLMDLSPPELTEFYTGILRDEQQGIFKPALIRYYAKSGKVNEVYYYPMPIMGKAGKPVGVMALLVPEAFDFEEPPITPSSPRN